MFLKLLGSPYWSTPAVFATSLSVAAATARLRVATAKSIFSSTKESAVGGASKKVLLHRFVPGKGNSFKPIFVGRFEVRDGITELRGAFTTHWFIKLFMSLWYGGCIYAIVLAIRSGQSWLIPLLGVGMLFAGATVAWLFKWLSEDDRKYLSEVIEKALANNSS